MNERRRFLLGRKSVEEIEEGFLLFLDRRSRIADTETLASDEDSVVVQFLKR